jgi:hypothetical protein
MIFCLNLKIVFNEVPAFDGANVVSVLFEHETVSAEAHIP